MFNVFCSVVKKMENRPCHILMTPGEGISYPLQYSGLENTMDCIVHGFTKSQTQPSNFTFMEWS